MRVLAIPFAAAVALLGLAAGPASAAAPAPSSSTCGSDNYACLAVADQSVRADTVARFTGSLSPRAMRNLASWTDGANIVCLTRYPSKPKADGSWPWTTLDHACTTIRKNGNFTINAELGRMGTYYYGLEMGPCLATDKAECGAGDPGLVGLDGKKAVSLTTI